MEEPVTLTLINRGAFDYLIFRYSERIEAARNWRSGSASEGDRGMAALLDCLVGCPDGWLRLAGDHARGLDRCLPPSTRCGTGTSTRPGPGETPGGSSGRRPAGHSNKIIIYEFGSACAPVDVLYCVVR